MGTQLWLAASLGIAGPAQAARGPLGVVVPCPPSHVTAFKPYGTIGIPKPRGRFPRPQARYSFLPPFLRSLGVASRLRDSLRASKSRGVPTPSPGPTWYRPLRSSTPPPLGWSLPPRPPRPPQVVSRTSSRSLPAGPSGPRHLPMAVLPAPRALPTAAGPPRPGCGTRRPRPQRTALVRAALPRAPQWFGRGDPSPARGPALGPARPVAPQPRARARPSAEPAAPRAARASPRPPARPAPPWSVRAAPRTAPALGAPSAGAAAPRGPSRRAPPARAPGRPAPGARSRRGSGPARPLPW